MKTKLTLSTVAIALGLVASASSGYAQYAPMPQFQYLPLQPRGNWLERYQQSAPYTAPAPPVVPLYSDGAGGYRTPGTPPAYGVPQIQIRTAY